MIKKPTNWENVKAATERAQLPAGGYVVDIIAAKTVHYDSSKGGFDRLEIALDIAEGEYKEFYKADFAANTNEDAKWKGVLRVYLPKNDGSKEDEWTKSSLKALLEAIEDSNPGFRYDWDKEENQLKGKKAGCIFRLEEWAMDNGAKKGWKAQPFKFVAVETIRSGNFKQPKFKPHRDFPSDTPDNYQTVAASTATPQGFEPIEEEGDLPF